VSWQQLEGPRLRQLAPSDDGFRLTARTPGLSDVVHDPLPWGVIPFSPRTRGEIALRATWSDGRHRMERNVRVATAARSRGLNNLPVGVRTYLGGEGWKLRAWPTGSAAALAAGPGFASLEPDVAGDYLLADVAGHDLMLRAGRYDETPLDCGRAGCHPAITDAIRSSPMTTVLARGLSRIPGAVTPAFGAGYPDCALACHATGEPGAHDGGFTHVAHELGGVSDLSGTWSALPRALRRLGGVGCLACHGPAALPPPSGRANVLRSDVCAICHDAPPRYGHVAAWRETTMARADRDPRVHAQSACARCHTTTGLLSTLEGRPRRARDDGPRAGITCAACHAVHGHGAGAPAPGALLRAPAPPALLAGVAPGRSAICLGCHTPDRDEGKPSASAAALFYGRGGVDPETGAPLAGAVAHARVADGCVGCHRSGPTNVEHGAGHRFATAWRTCAPCHPTPVSGSDLPERARRLWAAWRGGGGGEVPAHAGELRLDRSTARGRAGWNILLVLEDPAAAAHNAPYARSLLAASERAMATATRGAR
jgi:hypothetical protein